MRKLLKRLMLILVFMGIAGIGQSQPERRLHDLALDKDMPLSQAVAQLKRNRIILVGEQHTDQRHHEAQRDIIQALHEAGIQVAIGLEMFRKDSQEALDHWVGGNIPETDFRRIYYDNWNFPWSDYRMIFDYARQENIPMIGLNVPREITHQVSREGFGSLTDSQKGKLSDVTCRVDKKYMDFIRRAFGGHAHGNLNFNYFCEAQMVWDTAMALYTLEYLKHNPAAVVVVLTGVGHARKGAVPRQISERSQAPFVVILPEVAGKIDSGTIGEEDADYIIKENR